APTPPLGRGQSSSATPPRSTRDLMRWARRLSGPLCFLLLPDAHLLGVDRLAEDVGADVVKVLRHRGDQHLMARLGRVGAQARVVEMALDLRRCCERGVDQLERAGVDAFDRRLEELIVRAAE